MLPKDPFSADSPFSYRRTKSKYILYSIGPDGKDDGGRYIFNAPTVTEEGRKPASKTVREDSKGDIIAGLNF
jgi:hypothetical protein